MNQLIKRFILVFKIVEECPERITEEEVEKIIEIFQSDS